MKTKSLLSLVCLLLLATAAMASTDSTTTKYLTNMRDKPSLKSDTIGEVAVGTVVHFQGRSADGQFIETEYGWCHIACLTSVPTGLKVSNAFFNKPKTPFKASGNGKDQGGAKTVSSRPIPVGREGNLSG